MDRLAAMTVFARVVEQGSFARAAERMGMSTSTVSRHVADLEHHLGTRLLQRSTRRLSLTESGTAFLERLLPLLAELEEAEQAAASVTAKPRGTLRITCGLSYGRLHLAPAIVDYAAVHPDVRFDVDLSERIVDVVEEGFDLAIRIGPVAPTLIARPISATSMIACASPDYLARAGTPAHPRDLAAHQCIRYSYSSTHDTWRFTDRRGATHSVRIRGRLLANNGDLCAAAAVRGMGIVAEPDFIVGPELASGRLVRVLPGFHGPTVPIHAVYASRRHLSAKVRSFVDFLVARFAAPLSGPSAFRG